MTHKEPDGATPFDSDGLILAHIETREELFIAEAGNIGKATLKYLATAPSKRMAPFTREWATGSTRKCSGMYGRGQVNDA